MYRLVLPRESLRGPDGLRLGTAAGASLDFHDFRDYHPGDDLRRLDWGVYARTDREVVRLYREEVCPHADVLVDGSASMSLPGTRNGEALNALLSTLSAAADAAHCSFLRQTLPPPGEPPPRLRPHSLRIVVSDLLVPDDPYPLLVPLADGAAALHVVQLMAAAEEDPDPSGALELVDSETAERIDARIDADAVASYKAALAAHRDRWHQACRRLGASLSTLTDAEVLDPPRRLVSLERNALLEPL